MDWGAFSPLILPYASGLPSPLLEQHARLAAIDFLKHTKAWQADLAPLVGNGALTAFAMVAPTDSQVEKLLCVIITDAYGNTAEANVRTAGYGARLARQGAFEPIASTPDRSTLTVTPAQPLNASIVATVALKPTLTAATFPDELFAQYGAEIAKGAVATATAMANKPWTDLTTARINAAEFINHKAVTARQVERGFATSGRRSAIRWF